MSVDLGHAVNVWNAGIVQFQSVGVVVGVTACNRFQNKHICMINNKNTYVKYHGLEIDHSFIDKIK